MTSLVTCEHVGLVKKIHTSQNKGFATISLCIIIKKYLQTCFEVTVHSVETHEIRSKIVIVQLQFCKIMAVVANELIFNSFLFI